MSKLKHQRSDGTPCEGCPPGCEVNPNGWGCCAMAWFPHGDAYWMGPVCCAEAKHEADPESPLGHVTTDCHAHFPRPSEVIRLADVPIPGMENREFEAEELNRFEKMEIEKVMSDRPKLDAVAFARLPEAVRTAIERMPEKGLVTRVSEAMASFEDPVNLPGVLSLGGGVSLEVVSTRAEGTRLADGSTEMRLIPKFRGRAKIVAYPFAVNGLPGERHHKTPTPTERAAIELAIRNAVGG